MMGWEMNGDEDLVCTREARRHCVVKSIAFGIARSGRRSVRTVRTGEMGSERVVELNWVKLVVEHVSTVKRLRYLGAVSLHHNSQHCQEDLHVGQSVLLTAREVRTVASHHYRQGQSSILRG